MYFLQLEKKHLALKAEDTLLSEIGLKPVDICFSTKVFGLLCISKIYLT